MSDEVAVVEQRSFSGLFLLLLAMALTGAIAALLWSYSLSSRLSQTEAHLLTAEQQNDKLSTELEKTNARLHVNQAELAHSLGLTQKQLETRAQDLLRRQQADSQRLEAAQANTQKQLGAVSSDISGVKTDVGGVKNDVAQTKSELQSAETQLQSMKGDLGVQSGLIATNKDQLELLKHRGDRNYYEFTLRKGKRPMPVSTVGLELRKTDTKNNRYTINVYADDKKIEKKDRNINEPVQFYTGKDNLLYEMVVNSITKNEVRGYISTPKNAPHPVTVTP